MHLGHITHSITMRCSHGRGWKRVSPSAKCFYRILRASLESHLSPITIRLNLEHRADTISHPQSNPRKQWNFSHSNQLGTDQSEWTPAECNKSLWPTISPAYTGNIGIPISQSRNRNRGLEVRISKVTNWKSGGTRISTNQRRKGGNFWNRKKSDTFFKSTWQIFEKFSTWKHIF